MQRKEILIEISPKGDVSFTVKGVKGKACLEETKFLEEAMGGPVVQQELTGEYYEQGEAEVVTTRGKE